MSNIKTVKIVLPLRNCEKSIKSICDKIILSLKKLINEEKISDSSCLVIFDNASDDNTWYEAGKIVARNPFLAKAKKLKFNTKTSSIVKNMTDYIVLNADNYDKIEEKLDNLNTNSDKLSFLKDIFKNPNYIIVEELQ